MSGWLLVMSGATCAAAQITLVTKGQPAASIVLAAEPTRAASFAARELQYHLKLITGAELPIVSDTVPVSGVRLLVGESAATAAAGLKSADFLPQEYLVRVQPETIILIGRDAADRGKMDYTDPATFPGVFAEQATAYAVYDFLERCCGVRWYLPTELGLVCPKTATLRVKSTEIRRAPAVKTRYDLMAYQIPADLCGDSIRSEKVTPVLPWREQMLWYHRHRVGGDAYGANHSFYGYYDRFWKKNPANEKGFEAAHPDWFAQGYPTAERPPQMCFTNEGFIQQVIQDARDYFDGKGKKPGAQADGDYFALVPMDTNEWCKCANCQALLKPEAVRGKGQFSNDRASNYVFRFVNRVAREVGKTHPGKYLAAIAYAEYCYPPEGESVAPNVSVTMCLHARFVYAKTTKENDRAVFSSWADESKARRKFLYFYYCFPALVAVQQQFRCFPGFFAHDLVRQLQDYIPNGVRGITYEPSYLADERRSVLMDQLEFYLTWKLADDPTLDGKALIDEFFRLYYGAAAKLMQAFYERAEAIYGDPANYPPNPGHQSEEMAWGWLGTAPRMQELGLLMRKAQAAARTDVEKQRVALFEKGIWQYMLAGHNLYTSRQAKVAAVKTPLPVPRVKPPTAAAGDWQNLDWSKGAVLGQWMTLQGGLTPREIEGRVLHDGNCLYLQLEEKTDPVRLLCRDNLIWNEDDWEIFVAPAAGQPRRQLGINAKGATQALSPGDPQRAWDSGATIVSDTGKPDRWRVRVAIPFAKLLPGGVKPGDTLYLNVVRATAARQVLIWVPTFAGTFDVSVMGKITLEP